MRDEGEEEEEEEEDQQQEDQQGQDSDSNSSAFLSEYSLNSEDTVGSSQDGSYKGVSDASTNKEYNAIPELLPMTYTESMTYILKHPKVWARVYDQHRVSDLACICDTEINSLLSL